MQFKTPLISKNVKPDILRTTYAIFENKPAIRISGEGLERVFGDVSLVH